MTRFLYKPFAIIAGVVAEKVPSAMDQERRWGVWPGKAAKAQNE